MISKEPAIEEIEVVISNDGLGRAAIVQRGDGLIQVYLHWLWNDETRQRLNVSSSMPRSWHGFKYDPLTFYADAIPELSIYGNVEDARAAIASIAAFDAELP